jgi:tRNA (cytidine/uridine-2'-O-)-methyltransferase
MILTLFEPDIPQNTGSLIRLCACLNTELHIIEPTGFPFDDRKLRRVTLDYFDLARITRHASWQKFLDYKAARRLILLTTKTTQAYIDFAYRPDDILLLGRESSGVPDYVRGKADAQVTVPMRPAARSLNLALAASMVLGEALRQTKGFP